MPHKPQNVVKTTIAERRAQRWHLVDLVSDHHSGKLRETLLWSNIGKLAMTVGFIYVILHGDNSEWLWVAYGGIVVLHETASRVLNQKQQALDASDGEFAKPTVTVTRSKPDTK